MIGIFYDTETTGLPLFHEPSDNPRQPHIVQLAAVLADLSTQRVIASMNVIVRPVRWEIPAEVTAIHGITTQHAQAVGVPEALALEMFIALYNSYVRIAHNEPFDARIIRIGLKRYDFGYDPDVWKTGAAECTQQLATPILKLPPTRKMIAAGRRTQFKSANLSEAYSYFIGANLLNAHEAAVDVAACMAVYFAIKGVRPAVVALADTARVAPGGEQCVVPETVVAPVSPGGLGIIR